MIAEHYLKKVAQRIGSVSGASSLASARALLDNEGADIVLLDLTLPDSRMEATLAALGPMTQRYDAKFVALSSLGSEDIARAALDNGAAAFLAKQDISAASLTSLFDELGLEPAAPITAPVGRAEISMEKSSRGVEPTVDPGQLASQVAHDALGWASNIAFRAAAMAADPSVQASETLQASLASIRSSAEALTSFITGARTLAITELEMLAASEHEFEELELGPWLIETAERWQRNTRNKRLTLHISVSSHGRLPVDLGRRWLGRAVTTLLQNASQHAAPLEGVVDFTIREVPSDGPHVRLETYDSGGVWSLDDREALGQPLATGQKNAASAGLGLFTARRAMEAMGGSMTFHERQDSPGAYAIRLEIPRA